MEEAKQTKEAKQEFLPASAKRPLNKLLYDLTSQGYHDSILINEIGDLLRKHGVLMLQEDGTEFSGVFAGEDGRAEIEIGTTNIAREIDGVPVYTPFTNTMLVITWHKMPSGKYEVVAYLS
jgi:hypothetical protein